MCRSWNKPVERPGILWYTRVIVEVYHIKYVHNDLISNFVLFHIPEAIFDTKGFKFDKKNM